MHILYVKVTVKKTLYIVIYILYIVAETCRKVNCGRPVIFQCVSLLLITITHLLLVSEILVSV